MTSGSATKTSCILMPSASSLLWRHFFAIYLARDSKIWRWVGGGIAVTLLRTLSKASIIAFVSATLFYLLRGARISHKAKVKIGTGATLAIVYFWTVLEAYADLYSQGSNPETLTGRTIIWATARFTASASSSAALAARAYRCTVLRSRPVARRIAACGCPAPSRSGSRRSVPWCARPAAVPGGARPGTRPGRRVLIAGVAGGGLLLQAAAVPGHRLLGYRQVVPQVPPVGDLDRARRAVGAPSAQAPARPGR